MSEQDAQERFSPEEKAKFQQRQAKREKAALRRDDLRSEAQKAIDRSEASRPQASSAGDAPAVARSPLPSRPASQRDLPKELARVHGKEKGQRSWRLFNRAAREFSNEQFEDARRTMRPLVDADPEIAEFRELFGLTLYRLGMWELAIEQLERFRALAGTAEQNPVLMDSHRALGQWADVDELWRELGENSPSAELIAEGRIVRAGSDADRGHLDAAIRVLEKGWKVPREPMEHHLRRAYSLADLYERDAKLPKSRRLFQWVASHEPDFGDVEDRIRRLG